jgi:hypothetical protein
MGRLRLGLVIAAATALVAMPSASGSPAPRAHVADVSTTFTLDPGTAASAKRTYAFKAHTAYTITVSGTITSHDPNAGTTCVHDAFFETCSSNPAVPWSKNYGIDVTQHGTSTGTTPGAPFATATFNSSNTYTWQVPKTWFYGDQMLDFWAWPYGPPYTPTTTYSGSFTVTIVAHGSMPAVTEQVPSPSSFGQTVTAPEPVPGGTALTTSPLLGGLGVLGAPVSVDVGGLTDADVALINSFRHQCYVDAAQELLHNIQQYATNDFSKVQKDFEQAFPLYYFQANTEIAECLAFVNAVVAGDAGLARDPASSAAATQASCPLKGVKLGVSGSGAHLHLRSVRFVRADDKSLLLKVGCTRRAGGRSFTVSTRSKHRPLSAMVGSRLRITVVRSRHDASGGRLSFAFRHR